MTDLTTPRRTRHWLWIAAWMILAIYTAAYASMIRQYRAIPYWDQSGYVMKTYNLVEQWNAAGVGAPSLLSRTAAHLDPNLYLNASPPLRPPLLEMLPALMWRHRATAHDMAYTWLLLRGAFLMAGAWVLARHVGDARWVPAALAVTLASQGFLKLNQNLYLMDVPFACCALLAAALVARAMRRRSMRACLLAGAGTIALLLIKPQALAFMFPFYLFLLIERIFYEYRNLALRGNARPTGDRNPNNPPTPIAALIKFSIALLLILLAIIYLLQSPYGQAAAYQYKLNTQGFWAHGIDRQFLIAILAGLCALACGTRPRRNSPRARHASPRPRSRPAQTHPLRSRRCRMVDLLQPLPLLRHRPAARVEHRPTRHLYRRHRHMANSMVRHHRNRNRNTLVLRRPRRHDRLPPRKNNCRSRRHRRSAHRPSTTAGGNRPPPLRGQL